MKAGIWGSEYAGTPYDAPADFDFSPATGTNGYYAGPPPYMSISTTGAVAANKLHLCPIYLPERRTITEIAIQVIVGVVGNCRLGLYELRPNSMLPGKLVVDAGVIDLNVTGDARITGLSKTLSPGIYLGASVMDAAGNVRRVGSSTMGGLMYSLSAGTVGVLSGFNRNLTYGALPADETTQAGSAFASYATPCLFIK